MALLFHFDLCTEWKYFFYACLTHVIKVGWKILCHCAWEIYCDWRLCIHIFPLHSGSCVLSCTHLCWIILTCVHIVSWHLELLGHCKQQTLHVCWWISMSKNWHFNGGCFPQLALLFPRCSNDVGLQFWTTVFFYNKSKLGFSIYEQFIFVYEMVDLDFIVFTCPKSFEPLSLLLLLILK